MADESKLLTIAKRPISWLKSYWRHEVYWPLKSSLFERRHLRRLLPLALLLVALTFSWCALVIVASVWFGGHDLIFHRGFIQNIIASLVVLPIGVAVGVVIATLLQKHSLRFQARHASDNLGDCVGLQIFRFVLYLKNKCEIPIELEGPVDYIFVQKARETSSQHFSANDYKVYLPKDIEDKLYDAVSDISVCLAKFSDLRFAVPRSFDLFEGLQSTMESIRKGESSSSPANTILIFLHFATQMLEDLK